VLELAKHLDLEIKSLENTYSEISRVDDFVRRWVVEDGLSVDTSFVSESTESSDYKYFQSVFRLS